MGFNVFFSSAFKKELKRIAKKYRPILKDINQLIDDLADEPRLGTDLGQNVYKIRMAHDTVNVDTVISRLKNDDLL